jgi:hypothetical protein
VTPLILIAVWLVVAAAIIAWEILNTQWGASNPLDSVPHVLLAFLWPLAPEGIK